MKYLGVKSATAEKVFCFIYPLASEGKTDEGKELTITEGTVEVCSLHFRLEDFFFFIFTLLTLTIQLFSLQLLTLQMNDTDIFHYFSALCKITYDIAIYIIYSLCIYAKE